jgi:hypothetical protein
MGLPVFHRESLADKNAAYIVSDRGSSGYFLSAPRRTGKTTFIREDLIPSFKKRNVEVIYVDLWSDKTVDPGVLISDAITQKLFDNKSRLDQWLKKKTLNKIGVAGIGVEFKNAHTNENESLARKLSSLSDATQSMIVLVIDEAQHALSSTKGSDCLFALKAARDELNSSDHYGFRLVATGSNRDKLSIMVNGKDQAFYGAQLVDMPRLGNDYLEWERGRLIADTGLAPRLLTMREVFDICGNRPEYLVQSLDIISLVDGISDSNIDEKLRHEVLLKIDGAKNEFIRQINNLPPVQSAVLKVMALEGDAFAPYKSDTVKKYQSVCAEYADSDVNIDSSSIKYALDALRDKSLVWYSARGVYSIEDTQHAAWLNELHNSTNSPCAATPARRVALKG